MSKWREITLLIVMAGLAGAAALVLLQVSRRQVLERLGLAARWREISALLVILGLVAALAFVAYISRHQALAWIHPVRSVVTSTPTDVGLNLWEDIRISTADGIEIAGWFVPAAEGDGATMILLHGLGGNRSGLLSQVALLNTAGYHSLALDLRNHGDSGGDATTLGDREAADVRSAVDYLMSRDDVDPERIGIFGSSLGAVAAVHAAAQIPEIRVVVTESVFSSIDSSWQRIIELLTGMPPAPFVPWFVDRETGVPASQVDLMADLPLIAPRPMLFMHGAQDPIIDVWHSQRMYDAASEPKALYIADDGGHVDLVRVDPVAYAAQISDFLHQYLRGL